MKKVYVDDQLIGEARTWGEVHALIKTHGLLFLNSPGVAEGPSGFLHLRQTGRTIIDSAGKPKDQRKAAKVILAGPPIFFRYARVAGSA